MASVGVNKVIIIGNVGADPEIKDVNQSRVANFRIATGEKWRDKNSGERRETTEWHSIVVWNDALINLVSDYVRKGSKIYIEGQLQTRKYQKDGQDRYVTEVILKGFDARIQLLGGRDSEAGQGGGNQRRDDRRDDRSDSRRDDRSDDRRDDRRRDDDRRGGGGRPRGNDLDDDIPFSPEWR